MRKVIYYVHTSVDGYIAGPNGEFDWPEMGPELSAHSEALNARVDTFLYGRVVWDLMSSYWPTAEQISDHPHDLAFAPVWRAMPKIVVSSTLTEAGWGARLVNDDVAARIAEVKAEPGKDILLTGGAGLAATLADADLIDEFHVVVHPVVLTGGKRVLPLAGRKNLALAGSRVLDDRAVLLTYTLS